MSSACSDLVAGHGRALVGFVAACAGGGGGGGGGGVGATATNARIASGTSGRSSGHVEQREGDD